MHSMQSWLFLYLAIVLEVAGTIALRFSKGMSVLLPSVLTYLLYSTSFYVLSLALKHVPVSIAYAIWAGLGTTAAALIGFLYFREPASALKVVSLVLVVAGVIGLNLSGARH